MIEVVNAKTNDKGQYWYDVWNQSPESRAVQEEIDRIHEERKATHQEDDDQAHTEFAMPFWFQLYVVSRRVFQQYWRMPAHIASKWGLAIMAGLFIGFSFFDAKASLAGMQTVLYSLFMVCSVFASLVQQVGSRITTSRCVTMILTAFSRSCPYLLPNDHCTRCANDPARRTHGRPS